MNEWVNRWMETPPISPLIALDQGLAQTFPERQMVDIFWLCRLYGLYVTAPRLLRGSTKTATDIQKWVVRLCSVEPRAQWNVRFYAIFLRYKIILLFCFFYHLQCKPHFIAQIAGHVNGWWVCIWLHFLLFVFHVNYLFLVQKQCVYIYIYIYRSTKHADKIKL